MSRNTDFPRLLLVTISPLLGRSTGTDVTISSLLSAWPGDRIAQVFIGTQSEADGTHGQVLAISPRNAVFEFDIRRLVNRSGSLQGSKAPVNAGVPVRGYRNPRTRAHMAMRFIADASPVRMPREVRRQAREFAPDVVYSLLGTLRMIGLSQSLANDLGVPVVPHFMDDWVHTLYTSGELWGIAQEVTRHRLLRLMQAAPIGMSISRPMAEEYSRLFGIPFSSVANSAGEEFFAIPRKDPSEMLVIMYMGGLHVGRAEALAGVADALGRCATKANAAQIIVHCPHEDVGRYGSTLRNRSNVTLAGTLSLGEVPTALGEADILLHVESSDPGDVAFTRLSVSTKIPQYLAAGRPVLCFAPSQLASSNLIMESGGGLVVSNGMALDGAVSSLLSDATLRNEIAARGRTFARANLSRSVVLERFVRALQIAAGSAKRRAS
ncbi:MAG TPA: hypothetical protein VFC82_08970 [Actinomycetaceae bacterium]|nr:hypothetical protein [Actinomycetaceae bacterium]